MIKILILLGCFCKVDWIRCFLLLFSQNASLTHLFQMHPFSAARPPLSDNILYSPKVFWSFQGVEKGCMRNEWVKLKNETC